MWDIIKAFLGKRTCEWCNQKGHDGFRGWLANNLPGWMYADLKIGKWDYNNWVFKVGGGWHRRHHA